jgi:hypothetical protein
MSIGLKTLSTPIITRPGNPAFAATHDNPVILTYVTDSFYEADNNPGAKVLLLRVGSKYLVRRPITVTLKEEDDNEYIACFEEARLSRSGETPQEAIDWLKSSIVTLYDALKKKDPKKLGPLPTRQLKVLGDYLVAESASKA